MKRLASTIKQYDYSSKEEFLTHKEKMRENGYYLLDNQMFNGLFNHGELSGSDKYTYTATYIKSPYM